MKLISIIGSPHGMKGNTGAIVNSILLAAQKAGAETETFSLSDLTVLPCRGCELCSKTGKCLLDDDFGSIKEAMCDADGIIFASPLYVYHVSAQMKAVLDRCHGLCHCQMMVGKYGAAVVTSGGSDPEVPEKYLMDILGKLGCWRIGSIGAAEVQLIDEDERAKVFDSAAKLGKRMVEAISGKEIFPEQEEERDGYFERMKALVTMQQERWPFEYEYWKSHWGLEE